MANPRRQQQRALDTRAAIVAAALNEFARLGFDGTSTRSVADRAKVNHNLIRHHFGTKEDLWQATARHVFEQYAERIRVRIDALETTLDAPQDEAVTRELIKEFILFSADVPDFHRFMMQANQGDPARLKWLVDELMKNGSLKEIKVLERAQAQGLFSTGDAVHLRYLFIGAATSIFTFAGEFAEISGADAFHPDVINKHVELMMNLFCGDNS